MSELDSLIQDLHKQVDYDKWRNCMEKTLGATNCPDCCGRQYFDGNQISYQCDQKRKIYALRYLPAHIAENYQGSLLIPEEHRNRIFRKNSLKIASFGGGPGSDIAGFKQFIEGLDNQEYPCANFIFTRLDVEDGWKNISENVMRLYGADESRFNYQKFDMDICSNGNWFDDKRFDVILISYLVSELNTEQIQSLANNLRKCMGAETLLVINDRSEDVVYQKIEDLSSSANLRLITSRILSGWAGYSYDNTIAQHTSPKFKVSSRVLLFWKESNDN